MYLYVLILAYSKILVIDDLNLAKNTSSDLIKQNILKTVQNKISNGKEEIVIYNDKNNTRISSKDFDKTVEIDTPVIEQSKLIKKMEEYEKSVKYLKNLINDRTESNTESKGTPYNGSDLYQPNKQMNTDTFFTKPNLYNDTREGNYNYMAYDNNTQDTYKYPNINITNQDTDLSTSNLDHLNNNDRLQRTKIQEQDNLKKAIASRKEYVRLKKQEIEIAKNKLKLQMKNYRDKVSDLLNKIQNVERYKNKLTSQVLNEKNHINNLRLNTEQVSEKKDHVLSYIRITKNEVQRYKNMLENESNKLNMLEKQYDVYDDTLRKYSEDIKKDTEDILRYTNELQRNKNILSNLTDLYKDYYKKNHQIDQEIKRYEKIEGCLGADDGHLILDPSV